MSNYTYDELVTKLQESDIDHLQFVMNVPEHKDDFLKWCREHSCRPTADAAEFYLDEVMLTAEEQQELIHDEYEW